MYGFGRNCISEWRFGCAQVYLHIHFTLLHCNHVIDDRFQIRTLTLMAVVKQALALFWKTKCEMC